jgi:hypothetical protein
MKFIPLILVIFLFYGCASQRISRNVEVSGMVSIGGTGEIVDPSAKREYEDDVKRFNELFWLVKIFAPYPKEPKSIIIGNGNLEIALICDGLIIARQKIFGEKSEFKMHGRGGLIQLQLRQGDAFYMLDSDVDIGLNYQISIIPGVLIHKLPNG